MKGLFFVDKEGQRKLAILNPNDFTEPKLKISGLHETSLGLADPEEIALRNEIVGILFRNPALIEKIEKMLGNKALRLPENGDDFLAFYQENQKNLYWQLVDEFIAATEKESAHSLRLAQLLERLRAEKQHLYGREMEFGKRVGAKLKSTTAMAGYLKLCLDGSMPEYEEEDDDEIAVVIGQRAYNAAWSGSYNAHIAPYLKGKFFQVIGLTSLVQKASNASAFQRAMRSTLILDQPTCLERDIRNVLSNLIFDNRYHELEKKKERSERITQEEWDYLANREKAWNLELTVAFSYDKQGLKINLVSVRGQESEPYFDMFSDLESRVFNSLSAKEKKAMNKNKKLIKTALEQSIDRQAGLEIWNKLGELEIKGKTLKLGTTDYISIPSPTTNEEFANAYLENIYALKENRDDVAALKKQRAFFSESLYELNWIGEVINSMKAIAETRKLPLCVPEIVSEPGIVFKNLAPIDMLDQQQKKMFPFSFPKINGQMIALTGRHGRGKSVAGNSILQSLWLAQSGLPVFAESFTFDVKDAIGAVTNDKGEGSTATVFVQKVKNLLENISKMPAEKSLIFIDEIGKGTQEAAGLELGKKILTTLGNGKYSVLFNTQILALAEYAKDQLGAKCFKVDDKHQFTPGIGSGEMEALVKEIGLDAYLK